ncbi:MAG: ABC transporter ATP-binding protein [Anaerolineae bacterium]|nr:ABC transporter ATP-binding protein [Anaerolineae bacterium]
MPGPTDDPIIRTVDLTRTFKHVVAVDRLNLSVQPGEIFGLVGPDGAGKTTTIRLLAAIMTPTSGQAFVAGYDTVRQAEEIKRIIGYMAQRFNLYGDLTVDENIGFFADVFDVRGRERQERIQRLLEFARLTEFRKRRAEHLSGGMQKKLALACTLVHQPRILFLDEPTTGVDPVSRREFWDILTELHLQGVTLFISTPYMDEAERCSRVGLMYQGRLVVCDHPERIRGMVPAQLIELHPDDFHRARETVARMPGVLEVQTYGDLLHIFVDDPARRMASIRERLQAAGVGVRAMRTTRPRMEEAFISLVRQQAGEEAAQGVTLPQPSGSLERR